MCVLAIGGCGAAPDGTAQAGSRVPARPDSEVSVLDQSGLTESEMETLVQPDAFQEAEEGRVFLSVFKDGASGVELLYSSDMEGEYRIVREEQETFWDLGDVPENIRDIQVQPWGEGGTFLVLTAGLRDRTESTFILNTEMMSEVYIQDPYAMAESSLDYTVVEEGNIFLLGEGGLYIECEDSEALAVLEKNLWISDEAVYGAEEEGLTCSFPVFLGPDSEIGQMRLYYEFDGVGMNCVDTRFVPL